MFNIKRNVRFYCRFIVAFYYWLLKNRFFLSNKIKNGFWTDAYEIKSRLISCNSFCRLWLHFHVLWLLCVKTKPWKFILSEPKLQNFFVSFQPLSRSRCEYQTFSSFISFQFLAVSFNFKQNIFFDTFWKFM